MLKELVNVIQSGDLEKMNSRDFIAQRQAAFGDFFNSSFLADVHIRSGNSSVRVHSAILAAVSSFWRDAFSDVSAQGEESSLRTCYLVDAEDII